MSGGAVDTKTVEMRFDNADFEKNAKQSMSTLERLKQALKLDGASAGLKEVERASKKLDFKDIKNSIDSTGKRFSVLETIATGALLRIGASAAEAGMRIAKSLTVDQVAAGWNKYEEKTTAVQTIMANLRDTEGEFVNDAAKLEHVNKYLNKLLWFSDETSYGFTDMTSNVGKFIANGQGLEDSVTAMQGIATWAAISGQNAQAASRAMYNISQAMGTGSMKIKDWMSIENANMATAQFKELAIAVGQKKGKIKEGQVTIESFRESLSGKGTNGWFDKDVMMEVFQTYGEAANRIQEYAEAHNVTSTEAIKEIKKTDKAFADSIGFKAFAAAQEAKTFSEVVSATADAVSTKWMRIFENVFGNYLEAKEMWTDLSEQMWEIFASPLDTINDIMALWNKGFLSSGKNPSNWIEELATTTKFSLDNFGTSLGYVSKKVAENAVATDKARYSIRKLKDGTEELVFTCKNASGEYQESVSKILDTEVISGRTALIKGFQNIFDTFVHDVEDENGKLESISFFGSIKRALLEVIWGTSEADELVPKVAKKIWELTLRFKELTERLKPSLKTSEKIKNAFKGLFTLFKIGGKFIKAIIKPFKDFFGDLFKDTPKTLLDLADSMGTWIQKLDQFLDENKVFDTVSTSIKNGLDKLKTGFSNLIQIITGKSSEDFFSGIKTKIFGFFENYDFQGTFDKVTGYFKGIFEQIKQINTGELPEKLTPLQNFWIGLKGIFEGMKKFFTLISPAFKWIGSTINKLFTGISESISNKETSEKVSKLQPIWDGLKAVFEGISDLFVKIGPTLEKVGKGIGEFFRNLGDGIATWAEDKDPIEIIEAIIKGGFFISLTNFINSIAGLNKVGGKIGKNIASDLEAIEGVLKAYQREINISTLSELALAVTLLAGSMWILAQIPAERLPAVGKAMTAIAVGLASFSLAKDALKILTNLSWKTTPGNKIVDGPLGALKSLLTATLRESIFANDATAKFVKVALGVALAAAGALLLVKAVSKMADAINKIAGIGKERLKKGGQAIGQIIAAFAIFSLFSSLHISGTSGLFAALGALVLVKAVSKLGDYMAELGNDKAKMTGIQNVVDMVKGMFENAKEIAKIVLKLAIIMAVIQAVVAAFTSGSVASTFGIANTMKQFGKNFIRIALALAVIALAVGLMSNVAKNNPNEFSKVALTIQDLVLRIGVLVVVLAGIAGLAGMLGKEGIDIAGPIKQFGKTFIRIALALVLLGLGLTAVFAAMVNLANKKPNAFARVSGLFSKIVSSVAGMIETIIKPIARMMLGLAVISALASEKKDIAGAIKQFGNTFLKVGGAFLLLAVGYAFLSAVIRTFPKESIKVELIFQHFIRTIGFMMLGLALIAALASNSAGIPGALRQFGNSFLKIAVSLAVLAGAFALMSYIVDRSSAKGLTETKIAFVAFIAAVGLTMVLVAGMASMQPGNGVAQSIMAMGLTFVLVAASLAIVAAAFAIMASIPFKEGQINEITKIFGMFIGVVAALTILGAVIGGVFLGRHMQIMDGIIAMGAMMVAAAVSIGIVAAAFAILANNADVEEMKQAVEIIKWFGIIVGVLGLVGGILGMVSEGTAFLGMVGIAAIILAIGAACLLAGVGIGIAVVAFGLFADALGRLVESVATYGPEFTNNIDAVLKAALLAIINNADLFADAAEALVESLALGIYRGIKSVGQKIGEKISSFWEQIKESFNYEIDEHSFKVEPEVNIDGNVDDADLQSKVDEVKAKIEKEASESAAKVETPVKVDTKPVSQTPVVEANTNAAKASGKAETESYLEGVEEAASGIEGKSVLGMLSDYVSGGSVGEASGALGQAVKLSDLIPLEGLSNGSLDFASAFNIDNLDMSGLSGIFRDSFGSMFDDLNLEQYGVSSITDLFSGMTQTAETEGPTTAEAVTSAISEPLAAEAANGTVYGTDLTNNMAGGIESGIPAISAACNAVAAVIKSILGFSEPDEGPLSDFHTYAPDMIKLWNKGVYDNLGSVEHSTTSFGETIYDGFSTALDYVSDLIDNGMSDQLTIRPIMDLSEIQNGIDSMSGMIDSANGYQISGTTRLAASAAYGMGNSFSTPATAASVTQAQVGPTNNNFYITNNDPNAVADKVSKILSNQTRRQKAVWAKQ